MSETRVPSIPPVGEDPSAAVEALKQIVEVREGLSGDRLDEVVTYRDLVRLNLAYDPSGQESAGVVPSTIYVPVRRLDELDGYDPTKDLTTPPTPEGVSASGAINLVIVTWDYPSYLNHSYAEVWRSSNDNLGDAVKIGASNTSSYSDAAGSNRTYYYWVRFVSQANVEGPYSSAVKATTGLNPSDILPVIEGNVLLSSLSSDLSATIVGLGDTGTANSIAIQQQAVVVDGLGAQYTVKIDNNGHVAGFGLANTLVNGEPTSAFIVRADKFAIVDPASTSNSLTTSPSSDTVPFSVVDGSTYIKSAFIQDGTITNAKIADATIESAKIMSVDAGTITTGELNGQFIAAGTVTADKIASGEISAGTTITVGGSGSSAPLVLTGDGEIISNGVGGNKARFFSGDVEIYKNVPNVGQVVYKAISRVEAGSATNGATVTIPGYFSEQPRVLVTPQSIRLYDVAYTSQSQALNCAAQNIQETTSGSMVWTFSPVATLTLGANTGATTVNLSSAVLSGAWTSTTFTTPSNCTTITTTVRLSSFRGNGASQYYRRVVRYRIEYFNAGAWVTSQAFVTATLADSTTASATLNATVTFPSAAAWQFRIYAEAYDYSPSTLFGTVAYDYINLSSGQNGNASVSVSSSSGGSQVVTNQVTIPMSSITVSSGYSIYQISYSWTSSASFSAATGNFGNGTAGASVGLQGGGVTIAAGTTNRSVTYSATTWGSLVARASASSGYQSSTFGFYYTISSASHSVTGMSATIRTRKAQVNSTTASNTFVFESYTYSLTSAQVLATGTLNWLAIGD